MKHKAVIISVWEAEKKGPPRLWRNYAKQQSIRLCWRVNDGGINSGWKRVGAAAQQTGGDNGRRWESGGHQQGWWDGLTLVHLDEKPGEALRHPSGLAVRQLPDVHVFNSYQRFNETFYCLKEILNPVRTWLQTKQDPFGVSSKYRNLFICTVSAKISYLSIWIVRFVKYLNTLLQLDVSRKK